MHQALPDIYLKITFFTSSAVLLNPVQDGLDNNEDISLLHLEACPGKSQRVFACIRCSLKIFLLANGKLVEHMKNIHTKPISSALFFRPLQFLLTASKDGSSKFPLQRAFTK